MCNGQNWGNIGNSGHVKTKSTSPPKSGSFCGGCGGPLASKFSPCPKCGKQQP